MQDKSGLNFHFIVWTDQVDEPLDFESRPIDVIRWEAKHNKKFQDGTGSGQMLLWIAYSAAARLKLVAEKQFEAWAEHVIDFDLVQDDKAESDSDPTPAATPTEDSEIE